eukprot:Rmarinus@m.13535
MSHREITPADIQRADKTFGFQTVDVITDIVLAACDYWADGLDDFEKTLLQSEVASGLENREERINNAMNNLCKKGMDVIQSGFDLFESWAFRNAFFVSKNDAAVAEAATAAAAAAMEAADVDSEPEEVIVDSTAPSGDEEGAVEEEIRQLRRQITASAVFQSKLLKERERLQESLRRFDEVRPILQLIIAKMNNSEAGTGLDPRFRNIMEEIDRVHSELNRLKDLRTQLMKDANPSTAEDLLPPEGLKDLSGLKRITTAL